MLKVGAQKPGQMNGGTMVEGHALKSTTCMAGELMQLRTLKIIKYLIMAVTTEALIVLSAAFTQGGQIPKKYTCEGENINPPIDIGSLPVEAKTVGLIVEDPDAPHGTFDHWIAWNIEPNSSIAENSAPGTSGTNGFGKTGYGGPCPPSGSHRYFFKVYALDTELDLPAGANKKALQQAMKGHIVAKGELMAHYKKGA